MKIWQLVKIGFWLILAGGMEYAHVSLALWWVSPESGYVEASSMLSIDCSYIRQWPLTSKLA